MTSEPSLPRDSLVEVIRVLVVDDTATYRAILRTAVDQTSVARVVAVASNGRIALDRLQQEQIHVVVMDIEMPEMGGLETLDHIRARWPTVGVILVSGGGRTSAELTVAALSRGALDFVPKVEGEAKEENHRRLVANLRRVLLLFQMKCNLAYARAHAKASPAVTTKPLRCSQRFAAMVIGSSTGGPQALGHLMANLPCDLRIPVFVVQHMPPAFTTALASLLDSKSPLRVCEAEEGQLIEPGVVYLAPGGRHMVVRNGPAQSTEGSRRIGLNSGPPEHNVRPAVDVLFRSVAVSYQRGILAVMLSGMGQDGLSGVRALKQRGCYVITQSEASCVVYGMPRAVNEAGLADEILDLERMPVRLSQLLAAVSPS